VEQFSQATSSSYLQQACFLWEIANQQTLNAPPAKGATKPLFDPNLFLTGPSSKYTRWRVDFNGIGSIQYSPTVRLTPEIKALLAEDILGQAREFIQSMDPDMVERAVRWAYLSETEGSYAIEREAPTGNRTEAFAKLLARAHEEILLTEEYLVELQNLTVQSAMDQAVEYRNQQNWLRRDSSITYVPPAPEHLLPVMEGLLTLANQKTTASIHWFWDRWSALDLYSPTPSWTETVAYRVSCSTKLPAAMPIYPTVWYSPSLQRWHAMKATT
jgi:hypothetical protein